LEQHTFCRGSFLDTTVKTKPAIFPLIYCLSALITAFLLGWILLAQLNFLYGFWHDRIGIGEGIEHYGPLNRYKEGFAGTTRQERIRLFRAINKAVHNEGEGLADIHYYSESLNQPRRLLRPPEILHLQDVARLIGFFKWVSAVAVISWLACIAWALYRKRPFPRLKSQSVGILSSMLALGLIILLTGPVKVFYLLHTWIFPKGHPWFFYYQDSLMSTLMMAPRLFGWVAAVWIPLSAIFFVLLQWTARALQASPLQRSVGKQHSESGR
jgi:hypothetical protein